MVRRDVRQAVGGLEGELLEDLGLVDSGDAEDLWVWRLSRHAGAPGSTATASVGVGGPRRGRPSAAGRSGRSRARRTRSGSAPACGKTSLSSSPVGEHQSAPALGLTQIQSMPRRDGQGAVGLDRDLEALARAARRSAAASSCSSGSPPVQTTNGARRGRAGHRWRATASARLGGCGTRRRRARRCRRSRCRRTGRRPSARSSSRPVHRLQPAKRQKTAGRPAWAPFALQGVEDLLDR